MESVPKLASVTEIPIPLSALCTYKIVLSGYTTALTIKSINTRLHPTASDLPMLLFFLILRAF